MKKIIKASDSTVNYRKIKLALSKMQELINILDDMDDATYGGYKNKLGIRGDGGGGSQLIPQMTQTTGFSRYIPDSRGGSQPHNNVQPYITCYIWIRIK